MKKQMNEKDGRGSLRRRRVSPLSSRRGVETMMEEAGFVCLVFVFFIS